MCHLRQIQELHQKIWCLPDLFQNSSGVRSIAGCYKIQLVIKILFLKIKLLIQ